LPLRVVLPVPAVSSRARWHGMVSSVKRNWEIDAAAPVEGLVPPVVVTRESGGPVVRNILDFCDRYSSAWNPALTTEGAGSTAAVLPSVSPLYHRFNPDRTQGDMDDELVKILNFCQRHTVCGPYCLRKNRVTGEEVCRFHMPFDLCGESELEIDIDDVVSVRTRRNDGRMNTYGDQSGLLPHLWRANVDMKPILSCHRLFAYLLKYITKPETASTALAEVMTALAAVGRRQ